MIAHGKLHFREGMTIVGLLPRYPTELSTTDQLQVEQWARASSVAFLAMEDTTIADEWVRYFWRHSYEISACERPPTSPPAAEEQSEHEEEGLEGESRDEPTPPASLGDLRSAFLTAVDELGQGLRGLQQRAPIDTHESIPDEVKLGLASRQFRLLRGFVADPSLSTNQMAPHFVRSMIDVRIVVAWLMKQQTDEPFEDFKTYGQGKRKLFKLKLEDLMERENISFDEDDRDFLDRLREQVNQDTMEEFQRSTSVAASPAGHPRDGPETELADPTV